MDVFAQLFGNLLVFVYHCFDRIVINGYLNGLSRPEQVVHFVREVLGIPVVDKEVLSQRTNDYQQWVEAYARNHSIPIEWAGKACVKRITFCLHCAAWKRGRLSASTSSSRAWNRAGRVTYISKLIAVSNQRAEVSTQDPNHRILAHQTSRFTHYYFYVRDEILGPILIRVASFFPFHATYLPQVIDGAAPGGSLRTTVILDQHQRHHRHRHDFTNPR